MSASFFTEPVEMAMAPQTGKLPDFIIAGIQKAGTTSLFINLSQHPQIEMAPNAFKSGMADNTKEAHFFNRRWSKGIEWYQSLFNDNDKLQGEATPNYLFSKTYIKRMSLVVPDAKIIISLRNPVARAYSQYHFFKREFLVKISTVLGHDKDLLMKIAKLKTHSFDEAIRSEIRKGITAGEGLIGKGFYFDLIENLLRYYPRHQVLIVISEQMQQHMQETYDRIFDFLGVERVKMDFKMNILSGKYETPMGRWARATLNAIYSSPNKSLFGFLGYQAPEWHANDE